MYIVTSYSLVRILLNYLRTPIPFVSLPIFSFKWWLKLSFSSKYSPKCFWIRTDFTIALLNFKGGWYALLNFNGWWYAFLNFNGFVRFPWKYKFVNLLGKIGIEWHLPFIFPVCKVHFRQRTIFIFLPLVKQDSYIELRINFH